MRRVAHVITTTLTGGAEMMLLKLLSAMDRTKFNNRVVSLLGVGPVGKKIEELGIQIEDLGCRNLKNAPGGIISLCRFLRKFNPDIIQGWMYHGNLAATIAANICSCKAPQVWNIRQTLYDLRHEKKLTGLIISLGRYLAYAPKVIIYNSKISAAQHEELGYPKIKTKILPNGFDIDLFHPAPSAGLSLRRELGVNENIPLVGMIARFHPMKGHDLFIKAAAIVARRFPDCHFVLVGRGVTADNRFLVEAMDIEGISGRTSLLGERHDIPMIMAAMDVEVNASLWGEGFPNVLGEAMACAVPCVATDIGDSAQILGDSGIIIPPRDPAALADGICKILSLSVPERVVLQQRARARVVEYFALPRVVEQYEALYSNLVSLHN